MTGAYLDASAAVKLVAVEAESRALAAALEAMPVWVSSDVLAVELACVARRLDAGAGGGDEHLARARAVLDRVDLVAVDEAVRTRAAGPSDPPQRALDAIHLATAVALPPASWAFVSYDREQLAAARKAGLSCCSPGDAGRPA